MVGFKVQRGQLGVCRRGTGVSDLWGGVSGHGVNVRGQCGVCDDVTV